MTDVYQGSIIQHATHRDAATNCVECVIIGLGLFSHLDAISSVSSHLVNYCYVNQIIIRMTNNLTYDTVQE